MRRSRAAIHFSRPTFSSDPNPRGLPPGSLPSRDTRLENKENIGEKVNDGDNNEHEGGHTGHKGKIKVQTLENNKT